ncbi:thioredoxin domain-containing protein [Myxococcota bacterium]|nr:thioredoxin domain-containing protein [Myxococcota bacterium]
MIQDKKITLMLFFVLSSTLACTPKGEPVKAAPSQSEVGSKTVLAKVNGLEIRREDAAPQYEARLRDAENEYKQRELHVLWMAADDAINERLMRSEAKKRGLTMEQLREKEVFSKAEKPLEDDLRLIYESNRHLIEVPFEAARPLIEQQMLTQQYEGLEHAFASTLRDGAEVEFSLPVPDLPRYEVETGNGPAWGNKDARVTLIEFADYQCSYCGRAAQLVAELKALYPNDLRVVYRDFPLDQHPQALGASIAAQCAFEQGQFWPYHELLWERSNRLEKADLLAYAQELNLDLAKYEKCVASEQAAKAIATHKEAGERAKIEGTPAIFINGIKLIGLLPLPLFKAMIDAELGR